MATCSEAAHSHNESIPETTPTPGKTSALHTGVKVRAILGMKKVEDSRGTILYVQLEVGMLSSTASRQIPLFENGAYEVVSIALMSCYDPAVGETGYGCGEISHLHLNLQRLIYFLNEQVWAAKSEK